MTRRADALALALARLDDHGEAARQVAGALRVAHAADAVVVWARLDRAPVTSADLAIDGPRADGLDPAEISRAINQRYLADWLARGGFGVCHESRVESSGVMAAWRARRGMPRLAPSSVNLAAAVLALVCGRIAAQSHAASLTAALRSAEEELARGRRLRTLGEMASGVAHDFNNALTSIIGYTELALAPLENDHPLFADLNNIRTVAVDAATLVKRLQTFGRRGGEERVLVDLADFARMMPDLARPRWMQQTQGRGVSFDVTVDAQPVPPVLAVPAEIREVLLNLIFNAIDALPNGGHIVIRTHADARWVRVVVIDDGVGMPEEVRARVFEPFFSTKPGDGRGLGLSVCQSIAERHGGMLEVTSSPGQGTAVSLALPVAIAATAMVAAAHEPVANPGAVGRRRILLVDDELEVRETVGAMLRAMGPHVVDVPDGATALALARRERFDLVITDFGMPEMNGAELAAGVGTVAADTPVLLFTGFEVADDPLPPNVSLVLHKPVTMKALRQALTAIFAAPVRPAAPGRRIAC